MPIPEFTDDYHLPPGEHVCTFNEVRARFGCAGQQRQKVWNAFARCYDRIQELRLNPELVLLDGSFVTGRPDPHDVDAALLLSMEDVRKALEVADDEDKEAIRLFANISPGMSSEGLIRCLFGAHMIFAFDEGMLATWSLFFRMGVNGRLRDPDPDRDPPWVRRPAEKGILRVHTRGGDGP